MIGTNTTELAASSYSAGYTEGISHVLTDLNDLMFDSRFTEEERQAIKRAYFILNEMYPDAG